jgi:hypothetical protein
MITPQKKHSLRNINDKYLTPYSITQLLLENIEIDKTASILEPCSSVEGAIVKVLKNNNFTNITENVYNETPETNIFNLEGNYDYIITNTPYGKCIISMVEKMKQLASKQVIALYPISTLHSTTRFKSNIFSDENYKLKEVLMFVRPPWLKETLQDNGKFQTGINAYGWFIWEKGYKGEIMLKLLDNSKYCNRKSDNVVI